MFPYIVALAITLASFKVPSDTAFEVALLNKCAVTLLEVPTLQVKPVAVVAVIVTFLPE